MNEYAGSGRPFLFVINYEQNNSIVMYLDEITPDELRYDFNGENNWNRQGRLPDRIEWKTYPQSIGQYRESFARVIENLKAGNSFLTNLTCITPLHTNLTLEHIYEHSKALYKLWIRNRLVVFSPEIFVRIDGRKISSYPMKGTIDANIPDAAQILLNNPKEAAEHATIVDLIRNDLNMISEHVHVNKYRYIDTLQTNSGPILQTSSEICGELPEDYRKQLGDLLFRLLPAGSITGAPKKKTVEIIREAETYKRGFYTGIMGWYDGKEKLDSAVMIRYIEQDENGQLFFKSGGGITAQSQLKDEYEEMVKKVYVPIY